MRLPARARGTDRTLQAVIAVTAVGLLARLLFLGARVQHFDEGRVGWWTLDFMRSGVFEYRYIIHGPFIQHANTVVFSLIGATDFSSRLVVALVGGLLPLCVLLFRAHLRDAELVGVALFLAFNPVLLYYSRFFRSTVLVAAFMFAAFGFIVRFVDTRRPRHAHLAVAFTALGFTAKENAVVYLLCWVGAGTLVGALWLYSRPDGRTGADRIRDRLAAVELDPARAGRVGGHLLIAVAVFAGIILFFYAPRGGRAGLYAALGVPGRWPLVVDSTVHSIGVGYDYWFSHTSQPGCHQENVIDAYACFLGRSFDVIGSYAAPLVGLAVVGTVLEHVAAPRPRWLVLVTAAWGFASVVGYPLGTDVFGAWILVNALVPLAVPAGVGLAYLYRLGVEADRDDDSVSLGIVVVLLILVAGQTAMTGVTSSYVQPTADENAMVQYAQPSQSWRATLEDIDRLADANDGPDVLLYGSHFVDGATEARRTPACGRWFNALPLPWYFEKEEMAVICANTTAELERIEDVPPVVIALATEDDGLADRLGDDYERRTHHLRTVGVETTVYVRR